MSDLAPSIVGQLGQGGALVGQPRFSGVNYISSKTVRSGSPFAGERAGKTRIEPAHEALLALFLAEERARGRREQGLKDLRSRVRTFLSFAEDREFAPERCTLEDAYAYQGYHAQRLTFEHSLHTDENDDPKGPLARRTVLSYIVAASSFCDWLARSGRALDNPFTLMRRVRPEKKLPLDVFKEGEMGMLLDALGSWEGSPNLKHATRAYLTHVIAELAYASGLRISEISSLVEDDIDFDRALIRVRDGKKGSSRLAFLNDYSRDVLELYATMIRPLVVNGHHGKNASRLFLSSHDRLAHVQNESLAQACSVLGLRAVSTHGFRHALGYHLLRAGCGIRHIQAILGHKAIKDTEIYTKVDVEQVRSTLERFHPRS